MIFSVALATLFGASFSVAAPNLIIGRGCGSHPTASKTALAEAHFAQELQANGLSLESFASSHGSSTCPDLLLAWMNSNISIRALQAHPGLLACDPEGRREYRFSALCLDFHS